MVFASLIFIFLFLPGVLLAYFLTPKKYRNLTLLIFSYLFYLWGSAWFLSILIISTFSDYILALLIDKSCARKRQFYLGLSLLINLSILAYFKYANFFLDEFNSLLFLFDIPQGKFSDIVLPIGISFFTFQKITYTVDVYRGTKSALKKFTDFALYVAMFPQLIAGPIVRFHEISEQLLKRTESLENFYQGILRFTLGLAKKVVIANACGEIADAVFSTQPYLLGTSSAWIGTLAYTLQIYFDFSAYSDMAIGLGLFFGFKLPENFNRPYSAISITDFWKRWHITLSNFFRDYLYIPLGGNRKSPARTYMNLLLVFLLCGFWHGANITFIIWGIYHGLFLIIERISGLGSAGKAVYIVPRRIATLLVVMVGWVFFRSDNLEYAFGFLRSMFSFSAARFPLELSSALNGRNTALMLIGCAVLFFPRDFTLGHYIGLERGQLLETIKACAVAFFLIYSLSLLASGSYNPFIYFQF